MRHIQHFEDTLAAVGDGVRPLRHRAELPDARPRRVRARVRAQLLQLRAVC